MTGPDPWGTPPDYPPSAGGFGGQQFPPTPGAPNSGGGPSWGYAAPPSMYGGGAPQLTPDYGVPMAGYGAAPRARSAGTGWRRRWPLVSLVVGACGIGLAFAPPPAGWVGAVAGVFGIIAAAIGWLRRERVHDESVLPSVLGGGLSAIAIAIAIGMGFVYGGSEVVSAAGDGLDVEIGNYEFEFQPASDGYADRVVNNRLKVKVTSRSATGGQFSLSIGAYEGDSNNQIQADRTVLHLVPGASQDIEMFTGPVSKERADELKGANFRVIDVTTPGL
ncbi:hypothetical protein [Mycolicibacterium sp. XJ775]